MVLNEVIISKSKLLFLILLWSCFINSQTIDVCKTCNFKTIKKAIKFSSINDTIFIQKGTYKESDIEINKPLIIIGNDRPIIDGEYEGEIFNIKSDDVIIKGLKIVNVGKSYIKDYAAIRVIRAKNFNISDNIFDNLFFGIYIEKSSHGVIYNNKIYGNSKEEYSSGNGIQLWYSNDILVSNNYVTGVRDGIYLEFSDNCKIISNTSHNNLRYGLHFMFSDNDIYEKNSFVDNGAGVAVMFSKQINMNDNLFKDNWGTASYGLLLKEINDSNITNNIFDKNTTAVNTEGSNRLIFKHNNFTNNGWAIKVRGACYANNFTYNNFIFNSFDLSYNSSVNDNIFENNYWSSYNGYDLDNDGYGDVPYRPVKLFTYIVNTVPETVVLLRGLFVHIINFSEKVSPVFTPKKLLDQNPLMNIIR